MISHISNLNLNAANTIFNNYISYLLNELDSNNKLIQVEIEKVSLLDLNPIDSNYIINLFEQMKNSNNSYSALLLSFQKEYTTFESKNMHSIPFYSSETLSDILNIHQNHICPNNF